MLANLIDALSNYTSPPPGMYATTEMNVQNVPTLYGMVQCTPDLSRVDCRACLYSGVSAFQQRPTQGKQGAMFLAPSCNIRYEIFSFFLNSPASQLAPQPAPPSIKPTDNSNIGNGRKTIILISVILSVVLGVTAFVIIFIVYLKKRKKQQEETIVLGLEKHIFQEDGGEQQVESKEFPLDLVLTATENFSEENKLGEGGFGPVYKGKLSNGKEIAVKRLSKSSGQGLEEFKNEISLIARLQHRNLVRLWGCCLEAGESLLIYEYMPNKSLDFFLFDSTRSPQLDWSRRFSIIDGIARGLLYLHQDSRLRIIHRDLKVSNILLDHEMNPKISDFGMARIFDSNQCEANTNRVVGT
ncbi:cysteine-rich receptor-like protein kinase 15 [Impatiens glandulifera]|uniref:cysteine-rich receptor-like protein kinase 15 n=1 Tax=Impatiens glandulifera TaxID=253017 RepID=UPI001FB14D9E|nr:cysteine-rich receptor-like protein kinase 15 [Impatiens glandulifera]